MQKNRPSFVEKYSEKAKRYLEDSSLIECIFSRGTYQFEIKDLKEKNFPFLQLKDDGTLTDYFCSCTESEDGNGCSHLAASYLKIFGSFEEPLHVRFEKSFWSKLFQMASKRHGYEPTCLNKKEDGSFFVESKTKKVLFSLLAKETKVQERLEEILFKRPQETEETSIKFSNLSLEEIQGYRENRASHSLKFELSFWSDLAKWFMDLQEKKEPYTITFDSSSPPKSVQIETKDLLLYFYISEANWPWLIPSLETVNSPLRPFFCRSLFD